MLDTLMRPIIDPPLNAAGRLLAKRGVHANAVTMTGLVAGLAAAAAVAGGYFALAFVLICVNRIIDGLDGAVARASQPTDRGGYLDIVVDYAFYGSVPLAFAFYDPVNNAIPAAALLASFCLTCSSFLAFAIIATKLGLETTTHGKKSFFYSTGLVEGTETIVCFLLMAALPGSFAAIAWVFATLCILTTIQRSVLALKLFS